MEDHVDRERESQFPNADGGDLLLLDRWRSSDPFRCLEIRVLERNLDVLESRSTQLLRPRRREAQP